MQQDYLLFIVNKLATFCVTFLTEVKKKKERKPQGVWSVACLSESTNKMTIRSLPARLTRVSL